MVFYIFLRIFEEKHSRFSPSQKAVGWCLAVGVRWSVFLMSPAPRNFAQIYCFVATTINGKLFFFYAQETKTQIKVGSYSVGCGCRSAGRLVLAHFLLG
jgi:hypothetical protein